MEQSRADFTRQLLAIEQLCNMAAHLPVLHSLLLLLRLFRFVGSATDADALDPSNFLFGGLPDLQVRMAPKKGQQSGGFFFFFFSKLQVVKLLLLPSLLPPSLKKRVRSAESSEPGQLPRRSDVHPPGQQPDIPRHRRGMGKGKMAKNSDFFLLMFQISSLLPQVKKPKMDQSWWYGVGFAKKPLMVGVGVGGGAGPGGDLKSLLCI